MDTILYQIFKMSLTGSIVILAVLLIRFFLRNAPKLYSYALWGIVFFRLLCPFSFSSKYSFFNLVNFSDEIISNQAPVVEVLPEISSINEQETQEIVQLPFAALKENELHSEKQVSNQENTKVLCILWLSGIFLFITKIALDTFRLKKSLVSKVCIQKNVYLCDDIDNSFVFGIIQPKIYLPSSLDEKEKEYILCHEKIHIQRFDPLVKAFAMLALLLHWFNPLVWLAFHYLEKDMEMSCDEAVIRKLGNHIKKDYAASLLKVACSNQKIVPMLAFKEKDTEVRIKKLASLKKPLMIFSILCIVILCVMGILFVSNPIQRQTDFMGSVYSVSEIGYAGEWYYAETANDEVNEKIPDVYIVTADYQLYVKQGEEWQYLGSLSKTSLSNQQLKQAIPTGEIKYSVDKITDAYCLELENGTFYWVFQTKAGKSYLAEGIQRNNAILNRLYLLESKLEKGEFDTTFFNLSLTHQLQNAVSSFWYNISSDFEGYTIIGFTSDGTTQAEMNDLGFAVFKHSEDQRFYQLIQYRVYEDAVNRNQGICFDKNALSIDDKHFDILLLANRKIDSVERIYHYPHHENVIEKQDASGGYAFLYFDLSQCKQAESYDQIYYDKNRNVLYAEHVALNEMNMSEEELNQIINDVLQQEISKDISGTYIECHDILATELGGYANNDEAGIYTVYVMAVAKEYDEKMGLLSSENFVEKSYLIEFTFEKAIYYELKDYTIQDPSEAGLSNVSEYQEKLFEECQNLIKEAFE